MTLIKKILAILGIGVIGSFGADIIIVTEQERLDVFIAEQTLELKDNGHYKHIPKTLRGSVEFQVDEYETPNAVGYTISQYKTDGDFVYRKITDYGHLGLDEDWRIIEDLRPPVIETSSTTPETI